MNEALRAAFWSAAPVYVLLVSQLRMRFQWQQLVPVCIMGAGLLVLFVAWTWGIVAWACATLLCALSLRFSSVPVAELEVANRRLQSA